MHLLTVSNSLSNIDESGLHDGQDDESDTEMARACEQKLHRCLCKEVWN